MRAKKPTQPAEPIFKEIDDNPEKTGFTTSGQLNARNELPVLQFKHGDTSKQSDDLLYIHNKQPIHNKTTEKDKNTLTTPEKGTNNKDKMDAEDISDGEEIIFCMDFTLGFQNPTDSYYELSKTIQKRRAVFDPTDVDKIQKLIEEAPAIFHLKDTQLPLSTSVWECIFLEASAIRTKKNLKNRYRAFGLTLAGTNPEDILSSECFDGYRIVKSPLACALGGAYQYFGCLWRIGQDFVINWMEHQISPTPLWLEFPIKERNLAKPFTLDEMFTEDKSSFHCIEASMAVAMQIKNREDPEEWSVKIRKAMLAKGRILIDYGTVRDALMRIAKTHPSTFGSDHIINDSKLARNSMTALWMATYLTIGGIWWLPKQLKSTAEKVPKQATFAPDSKPAAKSALKSTPSSKPTPSASDAKSSASKCFFSKKPDYICLQGRENSQKEIPLLLQSQTSAHSKRLRSGSRS
jgi:hypothetical protein